MTRLMGTVRFRDLGIHHGQGARLFNSFLAPPDKAKSWLDFFTDVGTASLGYGSGEAEDALRAVEEAEAALGPLEVLVNSAGAARRYAPDELVTTEVFGPVITIEKFSDENEAVTRANDSVYGLSSSVWSSDASTVARMSARLDFGCVWVNTHIPLIAEMPHGGFKHSGYGKDLSMYGLEDYTRVKHVMIYHGFEG